jgi:hypothetical protein
LEDKSKLMNDTSLFSKLKKVDLDDTNNNKNFFAIVKGINAEDFQMKYNNFNSDFDCVDVHTIKTRENKVLRMCKLEFATKEERDKIVELGFIQLGLMKYKVEHIVKPPMRCNNCKKFGHSTFNCKENEKCARCSEEHKTSDCKKKDDETRCINCGEKHSSYYKGCKQYKSLIKEEIESMKKNPANVLQNVNKYSSLNEPPKGFIRNYSASVSSNDNQNKLLELLTNKISEQISRQFDELKSTIETNVNEKFEEIKLSIESITSKLIQNNNVKICHFLLDTIKLIVPNVARPDKKQINIINNRLNVHQMGSISTNSLNEYVNKLWYDPNLYLK